MHQLTRQYFAQAGMSSGQLILFQLNVTAPLIHNTAGKIYELVSMLYLDFFSKTFWNCSPQFALQISLQKKNTYIPAIVQFNPMAVVMTCS